MLGLRPEGRTADELPLARHARGMRLQRLPGAGVDHRADVRGQESRVADAELVHGAGDHVDHAAGDVLLQKQDAQGRAALAGTLEGRGEHVASHLLGQGAGIDDHGVLAAGLGDQGRDRAVAGGERPVDHLRRLGGAGYRDAGDARVARERTADGAAPARQQMQGLVGHPGLVHQAHGTRGDEGRRLGRLGEDGVAGGQRRRHLAGEDRQREVPRADAQEDAAPAQYELVALARGAVHGQRRGEVGARPGGVVMQEIRRLAHLGDGVGQGLAGLAHGQRHELRQVLLIEVGGALQRGGTRGRRRQVPGRLRRVRQLQRRPRKLWRRGADSAHHPAPVGRVAHLALGARRRAGGGQGLGPPAGGGGALHGGRERRDPGQVGEVDAVGVLACRLSVVRKEVDGQGNARMRLHGQGGDAGDGIGDDLLHRLRLVDDAVDE